MWWFISLISLLGLAVLFMWLNQQKIRATWYDALPAAIGMLLLNFSLHNIIDFRSEREIIAARNILLILGLPGIFLIVLSALLVWWRWYRQNRVVASK
jgi:uncharacterized membrane protein